ncbi:hypothetical protein AST03_12915 [Staphylococcus equorum]|uniref:hypothetical protein n=1 Tax=Staphylococcus equorum TaxID=246432 RepID=UPI000267DBD4|nr:hypothetical protein [Staphylococcus equorum]OEK72911.1 hypothetical protein AST03_12915 [Staphylococcus equorum]CCI61236.1 putative uncharacterized protein [Staphylococcus equorum subsp. equorum Mu2]
MGTFKYYLNKFKWIIIASFVSIIIIIVAATLIVKNHKVDVEDDVKVDFSGYNKSGSAEITDDSYEKVINQLSVRALKQANFKNKEVIEMIEDNNGEEIEEEDLNYEEQQQARQAAQIMDNVDFDIHNENDLKNGDKVKVKLDIEKGISKDYKLKAKEFTKEFKVKGLKEPKNLKAKDLFEGLKPTFSGLNGSGALNLISKDGPKAMKDLPLSNYEFTVPNNGDLNNGDELELKIPQSLVDDINKSGSNTFSGSKSYKVKVQGLKDISKLDNITETLERNNKLIKKAYDSDKYIKYNTENLANYYKVQYGTSGYSGFSDENEEKQSEKVSPVSEIEPTDITLATAIKVTKTGEYSDPDVKYSYEGYENYKLEDNRLVKDDTTEEISMPSSEEKLDELNNELDSDDFKKFQ